MPEPTKAASAKAEPIKAASVEAKPTEADVSLARAALLEITPDSTVGALAGSITEADGVITLYFDTTLPGYLGWKWTVSISHGEGSSVSVLETELTPAEGALLAPDWVPWSERLADYKEAQAELAAHALDADEGSDDDDDDEDFDDEDVNDDDEALLHSGDLDGVDIDSLDESDLAVPGPAESEPAREHGSKDAGGSVVSAVREDKSKKANGKSDDTRPEPPVKARRNQRSKKQQQDDKGE